MIDEIRTREKYYRYLERSKRNGREPILTLKEAREYDKERKKKIEGITSIICFVCEAYALSSIFMFAIVGLIRLYSLKGFYLSILILPIYGWLFHLMFKLNFNEEVKQNGTNRTK